MKGAGAEHAAERPVALPDQVADLAAAIHPKFRAMVLLAAYCSLRFGELAGLRRSRLDLLHRTVTVDEAAVELSGGRVLFGPPKTAASRRVVSVPPELVPLVEKHLTEHAALSPARCVHGPRGQTPRAQQVPAHLGGSLLRFRVSGLHFHDLRGSGATGAAASGATVREVMARLGHTTATVALRYQHATHERDRAIAEKLGAFMRDAAAKGEEPGGISCRSRLGRSTRN